VTTKLWGSGFDDPEAALRESLKKLQLEYVDLYIIHYPSGYWNGKVPLHVLWPKLEALRD
jgi:diketogulonate reductase-like aldo/keto reductase